MATVAKDFKIKNGLIVEGSTGTINNFDILTKSSADQTYIQGLVGGVANSQSVANAIVLRDANASFAANVITANLVGDVTGNADSATALETARTISLSGDATGSVSFDGTGNVDIVVTLDSDFATDSEVSAAQTAAQNYADGLAANYDPAGSASTAYNNAIAYSSDYTNNAVANLVDSAPALLDTLNELAAAIGDDANFATTVTNLVGGKQNTLTAGANIDITGNTISVTGVDLAGAADTAYNNAVAYADSLTTSDIAEGTSEYFTNARAKTAAAELLTGASLTNITITGNGSGLTITAENGVADSDTDDLVEGTTNLYFTNARAVTALEAVTPDFPAVEIASVAKQVAAEATVATASTSTAVSWAKADYRSAEFLVKIANGSHTDVSKVILSLDTSDNVAITEYAMVGTNGSLGSVSADVSGSDVRLRVTTANNNSDVRVVGTLLK